MTDQSARSGFSGWFEPRSLAEFRMSHFGRSALHVPKANEAVRTLLEVTSSWSVGDMLRRHEGDVTAWFHTLNGRHTTARVSPSAARELYDAGITLYLGGLPDVRAMVDEIALALHLPRKAFFGAVFCNKPNAVTRAHFDPVDIFCVQLRGTKTWWAAPNEQIPAPLQNWATLDPPDPDLRLITSEPLPVDIPECAEAYEMVPGSLLYLPRGYWHKTHSEEESISLHVGYSNVTYIDIIIQSMRTALMRDVALREAPRSFWDPTARAENVAHVCKLLRRAASSLEALDAEDIVPAAPPEIPVAASTRLTRNALASVGIDSWNSADDIANFVINVHSYPNTRITRLELSRELADATLHFAGMRSGDTITAREVSRDRAGLSEEDAVELLNLLETAGLLRRTIG